LPKLIVEPHAAAQAAAADAEALVIRPASTADEATPNHNAVAAQNLVRLAVLTGDDAWRDKADRLIATIAPLAVENLYMHMALLNAVDAASRDVLRRIAASTDGNTNAAHNRASGFA